MKKNKIILITIITISIIGAIICAVCFSSGTDGILNNKTEFVPSIKDISVDEIKKNTTEIENDKNPDALTYEIAGKFDDFDGVYQYNIDNDGNLTRAAFLIESINVAPETYADENGNLILDEEAVEAGYINVQKDIDKFNDKTKYTINSIYKMHIDGTVEELDAIPTAKQLREEFVNSDKILCYVMDMEKVDGSQISVTIKSYGWYSVIFSILDNTSKE